MWSEEFWLLRLVEKKKESRKGWECYDTKNQDTKGVRETGNEIDFDHMQGMRQT